jgi:hypothetical protein
MSGTAIDATITAVEDSGGHRALAGREALGDSLDRGREVGGFAHAQQKAGDPEAQRRARERVAHCHQRPDGDSEREPQPGADAIEQSARAQRHQRVGHLERDHDAAVVELGPPDLVLQIRRQDAEYLTIYIVDDRDEEQQARHHPAAAMHGPRIR